MLSGRVGLVDGVAPPIAFAVTNAVAGVTAAAAVGIGTATAALLWRLGRRGQIRFALTGFAGVVLASILALRSSSAESYFLPGIVIGAATTGLILVSITIRKPFVAWVSWMTRSWPLAWFWHQRVRPAYTKASWLWAGFFAARTTGQWALYSSAETGWLAVFRVVGGWPALIVLLVATYVLGRKWLTALGGPSVEEFESGAEPPWAGQPGGF